MILVSESSRYNFLFFIINFLHERPRGHVIKVNGRWYFFLNPLIPCDKICINILRASLNTATMLLFLIWCKLKIVYWSTYCRKRGKVIQIVHKIGHSFKILCYKFQNLILIYNLCCNNYNIEIINEINKDFMFSYA